MEEIGGRPVEIPPQCPFLQGMMEMLGEEAVQSYLGTLGETAMNDMHTEHDVSVTPASPAPEQTARLETVSTRNEPSTGNTAGAELHRPAALKAEPDFPVQSAVEIVLPPNTVHDFERGTGTYAHQKPSPTAEGTAEDPLVTADYVPPVPIRKRQIRPHTAAPSLPAQMVPGVTAKPSFRAAPRRAELLADAAVMETGQLDGNALDVSAGAGLLLPSALPEIVPMPAEIVQAVPVPAIELLLSEAVPIADAMQAEAGSTVDVPVGRSKHTLGFRLQLEAIAVQAHRPAYAERLVSEVYDLIALSIAAEAESLDNGGVSTGNNGVTESIYLLLQEYGMAEPTPEQLQTFIGLVREELAATTAAAEPTAAAQIAIYEQHHRFTAAVHHLHDSFLRLHQPLGRLVLAS